MEKLLLFGILSLPSVYYSWRSLFTIKSHGFYRFFGWECIIWLFAGNYTFWFDEPFSVNQIFSWFFLILSVYLAIAGLILMIKLGKQSSNRNDEALFHFEKTTRLIETGIFRYIRHPLYASLIYLTWGIYFKNPSLMNFIFAVLSTIFLYITSKIDEKECIQFFGDEYKYYMKRSKMFIPFVF